MSQEVEKSNMTNLDNKASALSELLAEVRELDQAAIPGPWVLQPTSRGKDIGKKASVWRDFGDGSSGGLGGSCCLPKDTALFVARARTLLPRLAEIGDLLTGKLACYCGSYEWHEGDCPLCLLKKQAEEIAGRE